MNATLGTAGIVLGVGRLRSSASSRSRSGCARSGPQLLETGWSYSLLVLLGAVVAVVAMQRALITRDFSVGFVADHGSQPHAAALQRGHDVVGARGLDPAVGADPRRLHRARGPQVPPAAWPTRWSAGRCSTMFVVCAVLLPADARARPTRSARWRSPPGYDGPGPNPLLQNHILMAFHPPMLYLGYVGFTVPFAFAIAALVTGRLGEGWLVETRRWTLLAWGFLTVGIVLGAWWSYEVLGWGGYWGWDPVENASLLPWLTGTAYLHSVMVQERRGMLRVWNLSLLCATFSLTILGTFLTRSGVLESVHAFSDSDIGVLAARRSSALIVAVTARAHRLARRPAALAGPHRLAAVARGRVPRQQRAVRRLRVRGAARHRVPAHRRGAQRPTASRSGPPYFNRMTMPIGLALLFLMAVAPVLPWRKASRRAARPAAAAGRRGRPRIDRGRRRGARRPRPRHRARLRPRRLRRRAPRCASSCWPPAARAGGGFVGRANGGMIVHLGVVIIAVAIATNGHYLREVEARFDAGPDPHGRRPRDHLPRAPTWSRSATARPPRSACGSTAARCTSRRCRSTRVRLADRHAVGADRPARGRLPHRHRACPRSGERRGHAPRDHPADGGLAVDRRRRDGLRHAARRLARPAPPARPTRCRRPIAARRPRRPSRDPSRPRAGGD